MQVGVGLWSELELRSNVKMSKSACLLVVKGEVPQGGSFATCKEQEVISFKEFKEYFRFGLFIRHAFSRKRVGLKVYQREFITFPLTTLIMLRLVSQRNPFILDNGSQSQDITFYSLWVSLKGFISDWFVKALAIRQVEERLSEKFMTFSESESVSPTIQDGAAVYLRTDLWFGLSSGGSVGCAPSKHEGPNGLID